MAIYNDPNELSKMRLQPGARGERIELNMPGYRGKKDVINRSNNTLNWARHDTTNIKYGLDDRLMPEFTYGYAMGFNQMIAAKGRIAAVDPFLTVFDSDTQKYDNALTLANGGVAVKFDETTKQWKEATEEELALLEPPSLEKPYYTSKSTKGVDLSVRPANVPIGFFIRNEETRNLDALNDMTPGAINTDSLLALPYFASEDKAKANPWGSAYGTLKCGDLVKSDTTGRVTLSKLSDPLWLANPGTTAGMIEAERQQVLGQVYEVRRELVPMGAAKYAQFALEDILNFEEYNPDVTRKSNRAGEDNIEKTPYPQDGKAPLGYDNTLTAHDLHMLGGQRGNYDIRMQHKYRFDFGIPGLTDGYNAVSKEKTQTIVFDKSVSSNVERTFKLRDVFVVEGSAKIDAVVLTEGAVVASDYTVTYFDAKQGILKLKANKPIVEDTSIVITYNKRGEAGVPTHLDWDGCTGIVKILFQK